jgi:hypothetical protein
LIKIKIDFKIKTKKTYIPLQFKFFMLPHLHSAVKQEESNILSDSSNKDGEVITKLQLQQFLVVFPLFPTNEFFAQVI